MPEGSTALMEDTAHSFQLGSREGRRRCRSPGDGGPAPLSGDAAGLPVPPEPRAADTAHGDQRLRVEPAPARRDLGRGLPAALPQLRGRRVGAPRAPGRRSPGLLGHRVGHPAAAKRLVRPCSGPGSGGRVPTRARTGRWSGCSSTPSFPAVWADHDRMEQVLLNLIDNALRHNPEGTRVEVSALIEGADGGYQRQRRRYRRARRRRCRLLRAQKPAPDVDCRGRARPLDSSRDRGGAWWPDRAETSRARRDAGQSVGPGRGHRTGVLSKQCRCRHKLLSRAKPGAHSN